MKTNYKIGGLLLLLLATTTACMLNGLSGNSQVQTEPRSIRQEFKALSVSQGIDVYLTTNQSNSVRVEADDNILDLIKTEVQNGTLKIYLSKQVWHSKARKVYVSAPIIEEILVSSGASVKLENTLIVDKLMLKASSGSEIEVHVGVSDLYCEASSGADITLIGTAKNLDVEASSGSSVKADDLKTYDANAKATSGATVNVNATNTIQIKKGSGGSVNYKGSPKIL